LEARPRVRRRGSPRGAPRVPAVARAARGARAGLRGAHLAARRIPVARSRGRGEGRAARRGAALVVPIHVDTAGGARNADAAEVLAALARRRGGSDRRPLLETAWRTLLACQLHDPMGGCVSDAVATEVDTRLAAVESAAQEIARAALDDLAGHDPDATRERGE